MMGWVMGMAGEVICTIAGCRMARVASNLAYRKALPRPDKAFMPPSGSAESHAHPHRQAVKAVHQANGKCQVANLFRAEMVE